VDDDDHDPSRLRKPDWSVWGLFEEAPEQDAVVLSCNVAPEWFRQGVQEGPLLNEIVRRLTVIRNRIETVSMPGFVLRTTREKKVRTFLVLRTFRGWAERELHWVFPDEFPNPIVDPEIANKVPSTSARPWPWGSYETNELRIMAKAGQHFFGQGARKPSKKEVSAWLTENGIEAKRTADVIAQILCGK
jgi:hypothetical protein